VNLNAKVLSKQIQGLNPQFKLSSKLTLAVNF
jgi:hypothetical protein